MNPENKITNFLKTNEIWFKTVLSLAGTIAALAVSIASCSTAQYQAQLSAIAAERENLEKQPFFSVENTFDKDRNQYIYTIVNTGGEIRDVYIYIDTFLSISQENRGVDIPIPTPNGKINERRTINQAFIYLPSFYTYETCTDTSHLFSFSDVWLEIPHKYHQDNGEINEVTELTLANTYFLYESSSNNVEEIGTIIHSELIYLVDITYTNYENNTEKQTFWLTRSSDCAGHAEGNVILHQTSSVQYDYEKALAGENVVLVDSMNKSLDVVREECTSWIHFFLNKFGQIRFSK